MTRVDQQKDSVDDEDEPSLSAGYRLSFVLEPDGRIRRVTEVSGITGWPADQLIGRHIGELSRERAGTERGGLWDERVARAARRADPVLYLDPIPGAPATDPRSVSSTVTPVRSADGDLQAIVVQIEDRTTVGTREAHVEEIEARFRDLAESLPHLVWESDGAGNTRYLSQRWSEFTGVEIHDLLGRGYASTIHPDDLLALTAHEGTDRTGHHLTFRIRRADGEYRWMEGQVETTVDDTGTPIRGIGAILDVTDRRAHDEAARENHNQLRRALRVSGMGRWALTAGSDVVDADPRVAEILGLGDGALAEEDGYYAGLGQIHPDDQPALEVALAAAFAGDGPLRTECRILREGPNGPELRWVALHGRVDLEGAGAARLLGLIEDVTDRKRAEQDRLQAQKREMVGTLVGGIAHDFNNVLAAILSNAAVARKEFAAGLSPDESLADIEQAARRAADLVQRVLNQGRDDDDSKKLLDIAAVADEVTALLRPGLPRAIKLTLRAESGLPSVNASSTQLHQVLVNLTKNAAHAIGDNTGTIEISLRAVPPSGDEAAARPGSGKPWVELTVVDDGPGMSEEVAARVFDPYFTTKPIGQGTGLGLAAVQTIVDAHGGTVSVESTPGRTAFTARLPAA